MKIPEENELKIKIENKFCFKLLRKLLIMMFKKLNNINPLNSYHFEIIKSMQYSFKETQSKWATDKIQNDYHDLCNTTEDEEN